MRPSKRIAALLSIAALCVPASAVAAEAAAATPQPDRTSADKEQEGRPEHFRFGPIVGVGFPRPIAIEGFAKFERIIGAGFEYSFMPRVNVMNAETSFNAFAFDLRVFPFRGAFFIGARAGRQWLQANAKLSAGQYGSFSESMAASTWFVNPRVGFLHTFGSGITLGIDAGVQFPISPTYQRSGEATELGLAEGSDIEHTLVVVTNALGNSTTPTVDLLRLGFLF